MLITVAMPAYNGEHYIAQAIEGVLSQTFTDFELLILDDRSKDTTWKICKSFQDPRIRLIRNPGNIGLYKNFNKCIQEARGKYLFFNHQDDVMLPQALEKTVAEMEADPALSCVGTNATVIDAQGTPGRLFFTHSATDLIFTREGFLELFSRQYCMAISCVLLRLETLCENRISFNPKDGKSADMVFWAKLALCSERLCYLHEPLLLRREHEEQASVGADWPALLRDDIGYTRVGKIAVLAASDLALEQKLLYIQRDCNAARAHLSDLPLVMAKTMREQFVGKVKPVLLKAGLALDEDGLTVQKA